MPHSFLRSLESSRAGRPALPLPQVCQRVLLQRPPNFLPLAAAPDASLPVGEIEPGDAVIYGLALARQFVDHHRARWEKAQGLSRPEAQALPGFPGLIHDALVDKVARQLAEKEHGYSWAEMSEPSRSIARDRVRLIVTAFLEEVARGQ